MIRTGAALRTMVDFLRPMLWAVFGAVLLAAGSPACSGADSMLGTVLSSSNPTSDFELQDQHGRQVSLADYEGRVVALTFLYTYCPDICPAVTANLKQAHEMLGDDVDGVAFVAISVDPERDTVERAYAYSDNWGMVSKWSFLVGDEEQLSPIWRAYYIDPTKDDVSHSKASDESAHAQGSPRGGVKTSGGGIAAEYEVAHAAALYLIDREGIMRVLFTPPLDPISIVHDIRLLLD